MNYLFTFFTSLVVSMAIIPVMIKWAPRFGMLDFPDARKVHAAPIPRVGGSGIVIGSLIPVLLWLSLDDALSAYLFGSLVLLTFGMWDDARNLGPYPKFVGQFVAALSVVYYGDIYIATLPFMDLSVPVAKLFTVFAIVGMINAVNVSDGLDGLAGGLTILCLSCIGYLAYVSDGSTLIYVVIAVLGGLLGFLRYNTYPAKVFMGDGGSQFLGLTLAFLAIWLTQRVNTALSPSLPILFLGLPVVDILVVIAQRLYFGISPFVASKHHIHHRLLELGYDHYEAVVIIYLIQALFVLSAIFLMYESDWVILSLYSGVCALLYLFVFVAKRKGWRAHRHHAESRLTRTIRAVKEHQLLVMAPVRIVSIAIPVFFVLASILVDKVPRDFSIASATLAVLFIFFLLSGGSKDSIVSQSINYVTSAFVVYLETKYFSIKPEILEVVELVYFVILAFAIGLAVRYSADKIKFRATPMDYLVILVVLFSGIVLHTLPEKTDTGVMAVKLVVIFYGCELIISHMRSRWNALNLSALFALVVFAARGV